MNGCLLGVSCSEQISGGGIIIFKKAILYQRSTLNGKLQGNALTCYMYDYLKLPNLQISTCISHF